MKKVVLLAEDNPDMRELVRLLMEEEGFEVFAAKDGAMAWQYLTEAHPDVILTDLMMPHVSGLELIQHIKATPEITDIPVIAMSAYGENYLTKAMAAGATAAIRKPDDLNTIIDTIHQILSKATLPQRV